MRGYVALAWQYNLIIRHRGALFISIYRFLNSINIVGVALRVFIQISFAKCLTLYFEYVYIVIIVIHFHRTQL